VIKKAEVQISNRLMTEAGLEPTFLELQTLKGLLRILNLFHCLYKHITCMQTVATFLFPTQVKHLSDFQVISHF